MGFYATGELIWGIPIQSHDSEGEPTPFWNEEEDDWREFEGELEVRVHGHYDAEPEGILSSTRVESKIAFCGDTTPITPFDLSVPDKVFSKANDAARAAGLDVDFYSDAGWWLVGNYG